MQQKRTAQTVAHFNSQKENLFLIPAINKIDLPTQYGRG